ncbi:hypothetical protein [Mycobacterium sp. 1465703.0]|uniref:hypothetical protein n=1 Tax=Mycobacterium sp. 1465703.0 TaxID=1834078 RepID=UPI0008016874|nr:hypothetical protein [Mycobacterium sp. 1465703.0]OBJ04779.1 hypothetical protein A5625_20410 [Mycobacterium sp. 1465703.0]
MSDTMLDRLITNAFEAINTTAAHMTNIAALAEGAVRRTAREIVGLGLDYRHLANELTKVARRASGSPGQDITPVSTHRHLRVVPDIQTGHSRRVG